MPTPWPRWRRGSNHIASSGKERSMPSPPTPSRANNDHRDGEHLRNDMRGVSEAETALTVRRRIAAPPERLFAYWTDPAHLARWWGPAGVTCDSATVDL